jgi:putative flavoprotein involved in K+ transport
MTRGRVIVIGAGQAGLAAARVLRTYDIPTLVLEAQGRAAGSWPSYYDSLKAFSPAEFSAMPGMPFPGEPGRYPSRDEVAAYLERYAAALDVEIRMNTRVVAVRQEDPAFDVITGEGEHLEAAGIVAATGSFSNPFRPSLEGEAGFTGELSHVADYRNPTPYDGKRVVVVGAGDSAAQIANELAPVATVTLATRHALRMMPQRVGGHDLHYWLQETGFDALPAVWLRKIADGAVITDSVGFRQTLAAGAVDVRPMFSALEGDHVVWADGACERVDAVILATGYRPSLEYLRDLGALEPCGAPIHDGGISSTHGGLVYLGLEYQRSYASNTLRGVGLDASSVIAPLVAWIEDAASTVGLTTSGCCSMPLARRRVTADHH